MKTNILALPVLGSLMVLTACGEPASPDVLKNRVAQHMASDQACNNSASVEYLPNGARVSFPESVLFTIGRADLNPCGQSAMANVIEAMLNPGIMQVVIEPSADIEASYYGLARQRTETLKAMISKAAFVPYEPPVLVQVSSTGSAGVWGVVLTAASAGQQHGS